MALVLARIHRGLGDGNGALKELTDAIAVASPLDVADARALEFEILRDQGRAADAEKSLAAALDAIISSLPAQKEPADKARAYRILGRLLALYGEKSGAKRAFDLAFDAAAGDKINVGVVMLDALSSAVPRADVDGAEAALARGIEGGAPSDDLVYGALWMGFVDKSAGHKPNGTAREILEAASQKKSWTGMLATWDLGRLTDRELASRAPNEGAKAEASFYIAMSKRARGEDARASLRALADSQVVDLLEVRIARDLSAPPFTSTLPKGTRLP
jgi:hypothetical protein